VPRPRRHTTRELGPAFGAIRRRLGVPGAFPAEVEALAAARAAAGPATVPDTEAPLDRRDLELWSIDPEGSRDLDQALHLARDGAGYVVHYAIADVGAWISPGDALDLEARRRGTTVYCPDERVPLHPTALSEGAASLLPGVDRPAVLWRLALDQRGELRDVTVGRALVRSRRARSYAEVQRELDEGRADEPARLLVEVGTLRRELEIERGGVHLALPEQSVERDGDHYRLRYEAPLEVEEHNAQISLCCGIASARLMLDAGCGVLRTLPAPESDVLDALRTHSTTLGVPWPDDVDYPGWVRALDPAEPRGAALLTQAARTLRGAGYLTFDGSVPAAHHHAAIAAPYAHVTAPLRRLVDRFAHELVLAAAAGRRPARWALLALPELPALMGTATQRASAVERAVVDVTEAAVLAHRIGERFDAVVTSVSGRRVTVQLTEPAVVSALAVEDHHALPTPGSTVRLRLVEADPAAPDGPTLRFSLGADAARG